ncbi:hypothetical protein BU23DRAFT_569498 [Bimuria novae-zelandiae CBS 107.79]|uniref:Uncharacterized protein n=1 Tax=Bimuria novae-zelandiae CBS 107.79 TaxID=1447943 RepID=A0A6A5V449_9PLEO|nr:hypothetical protein BU23DRAFT_569498 [Bimuria novae-zelandiae CBS 107.79]
MVEDNAKETSEDRDRAPIFPVTPATTKTNGTGKENLLSTYNSDPEESVPHRKRVDYHTSYTMSIMMKRMQNFTSMHWCLNPINISSDAATASNGTCHQDLASPSHTHGSESGISLPPRKRGRTLATTNINGTSKRNLAHTYKSDLEDRLQALQLFRKTSLSNDEQKDGTITLGQPAGYTPIATIPLLPGFFAPQLPADLPDNDTKHLSDKCVDRARCLMWAFFNEKFHE